jgi:hypothetical protein
MAKLDVKAIAAELASDNFPDPRLTKRLEKIVSAVGRDPAASLPSVLNDAELEGAYRFFSNPRVTLDAILAPHLDATKGRVASAQRVRVVHDQTEFTYRHDGKRRFGNRIYAGFNGHFSLVVAADETRKPLGLVGIHTWTRGDGEATEQSYWLKQIEATSRTLDCGTKAVHVADRGAEDYALFHDLLAGDYRFVMRVGNRYTESGPGGDHVRLREVLATITHVSERATAINRRRRDSRPRNRKIHPPREPRQITLNIAATRVVIAHPRSKVANARGPALSKTIELNAVRVWEPNPPTDVEPIEWFLFTNEPIDTEADVCAVVDHYRARWTIEEYFKALKTGCAFARRQLRDYESLLNALGVFAPLAFHVLLLRTQARLKPDAPASLVVSDDQVDVLRALGRRKLPDEPTARDVLLAIAALGGHIKYAPDPGWLTIARGLEKLELLTEGWLAAKLQSACDQR